MPHPQLIARAVRRTALAALLVLTCGGLVLAQAERRASTFRNETMEATGQAVEPQVASEDGSYDGPGRYDEPPLPPDDPFRPTWAPCISLRTNRSLVLGHLYWGMDIMGWATKGVNAPPLVTSSSLAAGGVIGTGDTVIRFGQDYQHHEMRPGGKLKIGWWFDVEQYSAMEWHYFELDGRNIRLHDEVTDGSSILARPFIDATTGDESAAITASDTRDGTIDALNNFQFTSTGIIYRNLFWASPYARIDYLVGYRHAHLFDRVRAEEFFITTGDADFADGDEVTRVDQFRAVNQFDGADLGLSAWWSNNGKIAVTGVARFAIGATHNASIINGFTRVESGNTTTTTNGGVLAQPSNIGRNSIQEFGTLTEVGLGLSWQPGCYWKFNLGYTWIYWSQVARALDQIDRTLDPAQLAPTNDVGTRPAFELRTTSFWAQGLTAGFQYQF
jgi:hypothetical protein